MSAAIFPGVSGVRTRICVHAPCRPCTSTRGTVAPVLFPHGLFKSTVPESVNGVALYFPFPRHIPFLFKSTSLHKHNDNNNTHRQCRYFLLEKVTQCSIHTVQADFKYMNIVHFKYHLNTSLPGYVHLKLLSSLFSPQKIQLLQSTNEAVDWFSLDKFVSHPLKIIEKINSIN